MMEKEECPFCEDTEESIFEVRDVLINALASNEVNLRANIGRAILGELDDDVLLWRLGDDSLHTNLSDN